MQTVTLSGLHCEACVKLLTKKLSKIPGVIVAVPLDNSGKFHIEVEQPLTEEQIKQVIDGTDYQFVSIE